MKKLSKHDVYLNIVLLRTFLSWMSDQSNRSNEKIFSTIIDFTVSKKLISIKEMTRILRCNSVTISRWRNGDSFPILFAREGIVNAIEIALKDSLREHESLEDTFDDLGNKKPEIQLTA